VNPRSTARTGRSLRRLLGQNRPSNPPRKCRRRRRGPCRCCPARRRRVQPRLPVCSVGGRRSRGLVSALPALAQRRRCGTQAALPRTPRMNGARLALPLLEPRDVRACPA
jgi:hypothetical protein